MRTLLLIDANSLIHRCFHALPPLNTPDGRASQSLFGIANILLRIFKDEKPEFAAANFDRPEPTFRKEKYKEYKAGRPKAPDELVSQIIEARNLFQKFGIKTFEKAGFEADDLIATLAEKFRGEEDLRVVILTGDLDTLQLVEDEKVVVRTFRRGISDTFIYNEMAVLERFGIKPDQMVDYKALVGDQSDNVKGILGVGPKTASDWLKKYGTLENIYAHLAEDPKIEKKLQGTEKQSEFSKWLVILNRAVSVEVGNLDSLAISLNKENLAKYFESLGFESLVKRLNGETKSLKNQLEVKENKKNLKNEFKADGQGNLFGKPLEISEVKSKGEIVFLKEEVDLVGAELNLPKLKVGFNLKAKIKKIREKGLNLAPPYFDLGIAFWLLDPDFKVQDLNAFFKKFLQRQFNNSEADLEEAYEFLKKRLQDYQVEEVFYNIETPLIEVLGDMERFGIKLDPKKLKILQGEINERLETTSKKIRELAGESFNVNSSQQLSKIIFDKLGLNKSLAKKTSGGKISTREESLLALRGEHEIIDLILQYREDFKIQTTYVNPFLELLDSTQRIHTEYIQTGAATGRLSSQSPNLQNIPQESVWAKGFRSAFIAEAGSSFITFDYSQIELRILAALSKDPAMTEAFRNDRDIHALTASRVLKIPLEKVGKEERRMAKTLNFGLVYGMGVSAFAKATGFKRDQAQDFVNTYFKEFSKVKEWQEETKREARISGYTKTLTGRRRYLPGIVALAPQVVAEAERAAINHPVQGLAADLIKLSMIKVRDYLIKTSLWDKKVKMLLTIHDELLFEAQDDIIDRIAPEIKKIMEGIFDLSVPLKAEVSSGKNWGEIKKFMING